MQKEYLAHLLELYHKGELSEQQSVELDHWFRSLSGGSKLDDWLTEAGGQEQLKAQLYKSFKTNYISKKKNQKIFTVRNLSVAATIAMVFSISFYFIGKQKKTESAGFTVIKNTPQPITPGKNNAILTLSNGAQIDLNDAKTGDLISESDLKVRKTKHGALIYNAVSNSTAKISFNTISTPRGGQYQVILSDGTHVWLNAASSLKYPTQFTGDNREVELSGEAYFEVAHNAKQPFQVISKKQKITVLGTHFNINTYDDEPVVKTTLLEGSVRIEGKNINQTRILKPGQQAILDNFDFNVQAADLKSTVAWKNGFFRFQDEEIKVIMNQIARWYDVDIIYAGNFDGMHFSVYISRDKSVEQILTLLRLTKSIKFKMEGRKIIVMK
jgi:transmembrane sensor